MVGRAFTVIEKNEDKRRTQAETLGGEKSES
jgi:hypothetical protein